MRGGKWKRGGEGEEREGGVVGLRVLAQQVGERGRSFRRGEWKI